MEADEFPQEFFAFEARRDDGSHIYGTPLPNKDLTFYTDGHPYVGSVRKATYKLVSVEDVPCDTDPRRRASWRERNNRAL